MGRAGGGLLVLACQTIEHGEIEFGVVDRIGGVARRRPSQARGLLPRGAFIELVETGQASFGGTQHLKRVKRRYARPSLVEVDTRKRKQHATARRARRQPQSEALRG